MLVWLLTLYSLISHALLETFRINAVILFMSVSITATEKWFCASQSAREWLLRVPLGNVFCQTHLFLTTVTAVGATNGQVWWERDLATSSIYLCLLLEKKLWKSINEPSSLGKKILSSLPSCNLFHLSWALGPEWFFEITPLEGPQLPLKVTSITREKQGNRQCYSMVPRAE